MQSLWLKKLISDFQPFIRIGKREKFDKTEGRGQKYS